MDSSVSAPFQALKTRALTCSNSSFSSDERERERDIGDQEVHRAREKEDNESWNWNSKNHGFWISNSSDGSPISKKI